MKRKRGDMTGARATKHSAKRIELMFGEKETVVEFQSKKGVTRAPRILRDIDIANNNTWVCSNHFSM